jgi:hypothetical protein
MSYIIFPSNGKYLLHFIWNFSLLISIIQSKFRLDNNNNNKYNFNNDNIKISYDIEAKLNLN